MATFTRRTITTVRQEFVVPAEQAYGAPSAEIGKAWALAEREYRQHHGLRDEEALADNAITFRPGDDEIVISYETRAEA
ncbi:hypothetical protein ACFZB4_18420 [Streptomyces pseudovenezuelae]|uniref:hypothetical protein n=1 Tax=Streptomyces pseudovenezuelae TaxID=67350 RepID=UPI0036DFE758